MDSAASSQKWGTAAMRSATPPSEQKHPSVRIGQAQKIVEEVDAHPGSHAACHDVQQGPHHAPILRRRAARGRWRGLPRYRCAARYPATANAMVARATTGPNAPSLCTGREPPGTMACARAGEQRTDRYMATTAATTTPPRAIRKP